MARKTVKQYTRPTCPSCGSEKLSESGGVMKGILKCLKCGSYAFPTKYTQGATRLLGVREAK
jgi:ribosomal protein L37AE/L43A